MRKQFRFEKLGVWHDARRLNQKLYQLSRLFPRDEIYGLTSQLRWASVSVSANIAEGSGRNSDKDFAHFLELSYGSIMEVASLMFLAFDEGYISKDDLDLILPEVECSAARIAALNRSLKIQTSKTSFAPGAQRKAFDPRPSTLD